MILRIFGGLIGAFFALMAITGARAGASGPLLLIGMGGFGLFLLGAALFASDKQIDHWFGGF